MTARNAALKLLSAIGALIGYGFLIAFLTLVGWQAYRWFHDGEWTHVGMDEGLHMALLRCCVNDADTGRLAALAHWLDSPVHWLGLHKIFEVLPASLALFALSVAGNCLFVYCRDRLDGR